MNCINSHTLSSPLFSQHMKYDHQIWLPNRPSTLRVNRNGFSLATTLKTKALPCPTFLATGLPSAGKLSVLLQTSALCVFAYWVANFVVPQIILKENGEEDEG